MAVGHAGPARLEILDAGGAVIRTEDLAAVEGLNRASWDLLYDGPDQPELRTTPPNNPHIWEEPRFQDRDTRPIVHWGIQGPQTRGPIAAPGTYRARVTLGDQVVEQAFEVVKDPALVTTVPELETSTRTQIRVRDDLDRTVDLVNRIEIMRKQIEDQTRAHQGDRGLTDPLAEVDGKLMDVELRLLSRTEMHSDDKWYVEAYGVYLNLVWLSGEVGLGAGDVAGGADHRPTDASLAVLDMIEGRLAEAEDAFRSVMEEDVAAFNRRMAGRLPAITDPAREGSTP